MPHQLQRLPLLDFLAIDSPELLAIITTTAATTVTITNNACTSSWRGITILQHEINIPDMSPYVQYTYTYVAIATTTRITFAIQEDNGFVALDDISVRDTAAPSVEILLNGGFEMNSLAYWLYCNPGGATQAGMVTQNSDYYPYYSYTYIAHSGNCFYLDGAVGAADYLSQTFSTVIGHTYTISYWLDNEGSGSSSSIDVLLSI